MYSIDERSTLSGKEAHHVRSEDSKDKKKGKSTSDPRGAWSEAFIKYDDDDDNDFVFNKQKRAWTPGDEELGLLVMKSLDSW